MTFGRAAVILVAEVELVSAPAWEDGPLPLGEGGSAATAEARRAYFNERAAKALHGSARLHRAGDGAIEPPEAGLDVLGLELVAGSLLVVHGTLRAGGLGLVESLQRLVDVGPEAPSRRWLDGLLGGHGSVSARARRAMVLVHVTPDGDLARPLASPAYDRWSPELQWLWLFASATPAAAYLPAPESGEALGASLLLFSAGWRALVLRDGAAFLGSGPDMGPIYRLSADPEVHFRSIYLDAFLLGMIQRLRLGEIADRLAALGDPVRHPDRLGQLQQEAATFRNVLWWRQLGPHWAGSELLRAYQRQHEIPELFAQVVGELDDYARTAQTAASQRVEALLGIITVVGLPFGLAVGIMHALEISDWEWLVVSLAAAAAFTAAILVTAPGRALVRLWFAVGRRRG